jgi:hypothetical protein
MLMVLPNKESVYFFSRGGRGDTPRTPRFKNYYFYLFSLYKAGKLFRPEAGLTPIICTVAAPQGPFFPSAISEKV